MFGRPADSTPAPRIPVKTRQNDPYAAVVTPVNSAPTTPIEAPLVPAAETFDLLAHHNGMSQDTNHAGVNEQSRSFMPTEHSRSFNSSESMRHTGPMSNAPQHFPGLPLQKYAQPKQRRGDFLPRQNFRRHQSNQPQSSSLNQQGSALSAAGCLPGTPSTPSLTPTAAGGVPIPTCKVAAVNFKFDSNVFAAPFRVQVGDAVVVQWDEHTEHIGIVATIFDSPPDGQPFPALRLVRHAREEDEEAFSKLPSMNCLSTTKCQQTIDILMRANQLAQSVAIVDTEWRLDHSSVTVLLTSVSNAEDMSLIHRSLTDTLCTRVYLLTVDQYFSGKGE